MHKHRILYTEVIMKKLTFIIALAVLSIPAFSYAITGDEAVANFKARWFSIGTMRGNVSWTYGSGEGYTGTFQYMSPGRFLIKFSQPSGKTICSNGRRLWVFDSGSNICGIQELDRGGSGGIAGMISGCLAIVTAQGPSGYTIKLKNSPSGYSDITLVLDGSFMLKKAVFKDKKGDNLTVTLSNVSVGAALNPGLFDFNVPSSAQVVKNPLDVR